MSTPTLMQRLKLRHKIAALGVVGMALCMLPLVQLLRFQGLELQSARAAQEQLEPAALAVELQRGLVDHRASAARWLQGQRQAAAQRRQHQAVVDARLTMLDRGLEPTALLSARNEVAALRADWLSLVQRVVDSRCSVADSDFAHRLLVEQTLQVIDFVTAAATPTPEAARLQQATAWARAQMQPGVPAWPAATATLVAAQAQLQQAQSERVALHEARRTAAAAAVLALTLGSVGLLGWLLAVRRRLSMPAPSTHDPASAPSTWPAPSPDGQQMARSTRHGLLQRLRRPAQPAPRLDQPTEPQEP